MAHSPLFHYRRLIESGDFTRDKGQLAAVEALDALWRELQRRRRGSLLQRLRGQRTPARGLYLWGSVGRGKTWLMDLFFEHLPEDRKLRIHFHRFMQRIHADLRASGNVQDPLPRIAAQWARHFRVLCLDEFFVGDIADAMLIGGLLDNLFRNGVTLVTTSNLAPDELYRDGLQRAKFLPAIDLIREHTQVLEVAGTTDYRLRILEQSEIMHYPLEPGAEAALAQSFERMASECELNPQLEINGRPFAAKRRGDGIIWFDFSELCEQPRGSVDYIEIARAFNTVLVSGVRKLGEKDADAARRFITLVDEFYDRNVKLLMTTEAPPNELYDGRRLSFEFQRTASRLTEMQSHDYLARPHLP
ncbi:MAG: cell division protein ZapE [Lysobacterales bacterium]